MLKSISKQSAMEFNSDTSLSIYRRKRQRAKTVEDIKQLKLKHGKTEVSDVEQENLDVTTTDYEQMRQRNIAEKMAFLESLNIEQAKEEVTKSLPRRQSVKGLKVKQEKTPLPTRPKSLRIQGLQPDASPVPPLKSSILHATNDLSSVYDKPRKSSEPFKFSAVSIQDESESDMFTSSLQGIAEEPTDSDSAYDVDQYIEYFNSMKLDSHMVVKITPDRIFSVAVHPSPTKILICAGSKWGHIGFYTVDSNKNESGVFCFEPHVRPVNCVDFCSVYSNRLYSCSYDGTMRCGDMEKGIFTQIYATKEEDFIRCTYYDFFSPETFIVSHSDGSVAIVDSRTNHSHAELVYNVHARLLKTVSVNKTRKDYFAIASNDGIVKLFDIREMKKRVPCYVAELEHSKSVSSAFFSPVTGNRILCTTMANKLNVYDSSDLSAEIKLKCSISHDCRTGRWLTPFRAVWLPGCEDAFIVGSMAYPRHIKVCNTRGHIIHTFAGEYLASVCSVNAFHPSRPILVGGNSSGKIHVFYGEKTV